jgi:hypothetical protein
MSMLHQFVSPIASTVLLTIYDSYKRYFLRELMYED